MSSWQVRRVLGFVAIAAAAIVGCSSPLPATGNVVRLTTSEGTEAELTVVDLSGLLLTARNAPQAATGSQFEVTSAPESRNSLAVTWIAAPCESHPQVTIEGDSLDALSVVVDVGPIVGEGECPDIGALFAVMLEFTGNVSPDDVEGGLVN